MRVSPSLYFYCRKETLKHHFVNKISASYHYFVVNIMRGFRLKLEAGRDIWCLLSDVRYCNMTMTIQTLVLMRTLVNRLI